MANSGSGIVKANSDNSGQLVSTDRDLKSLIYQMRSQQVMLDSDLATLYGVETRVLNQAVTRNPERFSERFCFRLTKEEANLLKSQIVMFHPEQGNLDTHWRHMPRVFTEQGISMLSAVLRSDTAVRTSVAIMDAFVQMRRFLADTAGLLQRMDVMEGRQLEYQKHTDERFEQVFGYLEAHGAKESIQTIFFDGQIYDAFELLTGLVKKAKEGIVLIDGYVDLDTLNILAKKRKGVDVYLYTAKRGDRLTDADIKKFNAQYPTLTAAMTDAFHDRFLILDGTEGYHLGASLKDAGKKCFGISKIEGECLVQAILERLEK